MDGTFFIVYEISIATVFFAFCTWLYFLFYIIKSFKQSPVLEAYKFDTYIHPKVSIIIPALNEENNITKCLDNLLTQDYPNFEIVAVNDSSFDTTGEIMHTYRARNSKRILVITAKSKPVDWVGKSWACYQGYLHASGEIFVFLDADTTLCSPSAISLAVIYLIEQKLDALTARPKIICGNLWTKIMLPLLWTFSHIKYSSLSINNAKSKTGYFFGCFYLITRKTYESIGTHKAVKREIVEDAALGQKVKQKKFKLKMVRGEHCISTKMTSDFMTFWQGLKRSINMIPFGSKDIPNICIVFFLLLEPFILLPFSLYLVLMHSSSTSEDKNLLGQILVVVDLLSIVLIISVFAIQLSIGLFLSPIYALFSPIACAIISIGFILAIVKSRRRGATIRWRGRQYVITEKIYGTAHPKNK
jgi:cellulose synthase/poly-beta-1,6-N-acetylglucosamine synthase-like glycosyltransferase